MINGIDYNGRRGAHPKLNGVSICDCLKHIAKRNANPMQIQGVNPITTPNIVTATPDVNVIIALSGNQDALNGYLATFNTPVVATPDNPNVNIPQAPVNNIPMQNEYTALVNIDTSGKGMAKVTDGRNHAVSKFTDGIHDFRFATIYVTKAIVADGEWELVLRKKA
jgi:hypothetical protein